MNGRKRKTYADLLSSIPVLLAKFRKQTNPQNSRTLIRLAPPDEVATRGIPSSPLLLFTFSVIAHALFCVAESRSAKISATGACRAAAAGATNYPRLLPPRDDRATHDLPQPRRAKSANTETVPSQLHNHHYLRLLLTSQPNPRGPGAGRVQYNQVR